MLNDKNQFEYLDPLGIMDTAEQKEKTGYEPASNEPSVVREIIRDEQFTAHCRALSGQRAFLQKKGLCEKTIVDELWKRLTYK